jgi:hypothetical protein
MKVSSTAFCDFDTQAEKEGCCVPGQEMAEEKKKKKKESEWKHAGAAVLFFAFCSCASGSRVRH